MNLNKAGQAIRCFVVVMAAGLASATSADPVAPHWVNVREPPYNAVGNGVADDTEAISNALGSLVSRPGGTVFLPPGKYRITGSLVVPPRVVLLGSFRAPAQADPSLGGTVILADIWYSPPPPGKTASTSPLITLTGANSGIEGLTIYYPNQTATNPPKVYPYTIKRLWASGLAAVQVDAGRVRITGNYFTDYAGQTAIQINTTTDRAIVTSNDAVGSSNTVLGSKTRRVVANNLSP